MTEPLQPDDLSGRFYEEPPLEMMRPLPPRPLTPEERARLVDPIENAKAALRAGFRRGPAYASLYDADGKRIAGPMPAKVVWDFKTDEDRVAHLRCGWIPAALYWLARRLNRPRPRRWARKLDRRLRRQHETSIRQIGEYARAFGLKTTDAANARGPAHGGGSLHASGYRTMADQARLFDAFYGPHTRRSEHFSHHGLHRYDSGTPMADRLIDMIETSQRESAFRTSERMRSGLFRVTAATESFRDSLMRMAYELQRVDRTARRRRDEGRMRTYERFIRERHPEDPVRWRALWAAMKLEFVMAWRRETGYYDPPERPR